MTIVAVLLCVEVVADKIPALDSVNDAIQTVVRPTSGGIVFGAGTASQTAAVTDPGRLRLVRPMDPDRDRCRRGPGDAPDEDRRAARRQRRDRRYGGTGA